MYLFVKDNLLITGTYESVKKRLSQLSEKRYTFSDVNTDGGSDRAEALLKQMEQESSSESEGNSEVTSLDSDEGM